MSRIARILIAFSLVVLALPVLVAAGGGDARSEHQRVVDFWTPERVAQAVPRDFAFDVKTGRFVPVKPGNGNGGGKPGGGDPPADGGTVTGASWTSGGAVVGSTGKVLFELGVDANGNPQYWVCSASVVTDSRSGESVILTAGHCVYDNEIDEFASMWMFVPDYDAAPAPLTTSGSFCALTEYGCWSAEALVVHDGFASEPGFTANAVLHDFAFAVVGEGGHDGHTLAESLGSQGIDFSSMSKNTSVHAFGYPHALPYDGTDLVYCAGSVNFDNRLFKATYKLGCDMTGGASGGPWGIGMDDGSGTITSLNSYKYGNDAGSMYGPKFNANTEALYDAAMTAGSDTIVP